MAHSMKRILNDNLNERGEEMFFSACVLNLPRLVPSASRILPVAIEVLTQPCQPTVGFTPIHATC